MQTIASLTPSDRAQLFEDTASELGTIQEPGLIEKDFWACWVLDQLFRADSPYPSIIFKGGTSLSKGYRAIKRFSEDLDLSFDRNDLGFGGNRDPVNAPSNKKAKRLIEELKAACSRYVQAELRTLLAKDFSEHLEESGSAWALDLDTQDPDGQTLLFQYPETRITLSQGRYLTPSVKLEFGARSDHWPEVDLEISPYARDAFPGVFPQALCRVRTLAVERTFWEKATILHSKGHGGPNRIRARESRHFYDLYQLSKGEYRNTALERLDLLEAVVAHKKLFFPSGWAHYDLAKPGSLSLVPGDDVIDVLRPDYARMSAMFFGERPEFEAIMQGLSDLEREINSA